MNASNNISLPEVVPVMSLSNTTLFPQAVIPLYIFEERYRTMLSDALSTHRMIGIADIESDFESITNDPNKIASVGIIRACKKNSDGTSHLILQGLARIYIKQLSFDQPYAQAKILEAKSLKKETSSDYLNIKPTLLESIQNLLQLNHQLPEDILPFLANIDDPETILDIAIASICPSGSEKQILLETLDLEERYNVFQNFLIKEKERIQINKKLLGDLDENDTKNN